jgi:hypothetical protein
MSSRNWPRTGAGCCARPGMPRSRLRQRQDSQSAAVEREQAGPAPPAPRRGLQGRSANRQGSVPARCRRGCCAAQPRGAGAAASTARKARRPGEVLPREAKKPGRVLHRLPQGLLLPGQFVQQCTVTEIRPSTPWPVLPFRLGKRAPGAGPCPWSRAAAGRRRGRCGAGQSPAPPGQLHCTQAIHLPGPVGERPELPHQGGQILGLGPRSNYWAGRGVKPPGPRPRRSG